MTNLCKKNAFCSLLTAEQRETLCRHCIQTTWTKGQVLDSPISQKYATLLLNGLVVSQTSSVPGEIRTTDIYVTGDFISYFAFASECIEPFSPNSALCIRDTHLILFPLEDIRRLFVQNTEVAQFMLRATNNQLLRSHAYLHFVLQQDAYSALTYLLNFCKQHHVPRLTYNELATISNLHRVTVTRTMKEILRSEDFRA